MANVLRVLLNLVCLAALAVIAPSLERRSPRGHRPVDAVAFTWLVGSTAAMLALDTAGWALDGTPGPAARVALYAVNALYFALHSLPTILYAVYADYQIRRDAGRSIALLRPLGLLALALAAFAVSTPATKLLFRLDDANRYVRGPAYVPFVAILFGLFALSAAFAAAGRKKVRAEVFWTLVAYPVPVLAAAVAQNLVYGLVLIWPTTTLFLLTASFTIQRHRAGTDHLTGAANRRSLDEEIERLVSSGRAFGGALIDLDDFKSINDNLGHEAGDCALEDAAAILRAAVRGGDVVARFGGDEFVVLLPAATADSLSDVISRLRARVEAHNASESRPYGLAFSVGWAIYDPSLDGSAARFFARLDRAMFADKAARKAARRPTP